MPSSIPESVTRPAVARAEPARESRRPLALTRALRASGRFTRRKPLGAVWRFARYKPLGALSALIVVAMLVMAAFAERIAPYSYDESVRGARMNPRAPATGSAPTISPAICGAGSSTAPACPSPSAS